MMPAMVDAASKPPRKVIEAYVVGVSRAGILDCSFDQVAAALHWLLEQLELHPGAVRAYLLKQPYPHWHGRIDVFRVDPKTIVITGDEDFAAAVRKLLPCRGWWQRCLPTPGTPTETLSCWLPNRMVNALLRDHFTTVEQIAVVPDAALLTIRGVGASSVAPIRDAIIAATGDVHDNRPVLRLASEQQRELVALLSILTDHAQALDDHDTAARVQAFLTYTLDVPAHAYARRPGQHLPASPAF